VLARRAAGLFVAGAARRQVLAIGPLHSSECVVMPVFFTPRTLTFLRALKRNNDREWFKARKEEYEEHVHGPMVALIAQLSQDMASFAPDIVVSPRAIFRIYRDTRFSEDKTPLKTHIAASFPTRSLPKHGGAGLYVQVAIEGAWAGGGIYGAEKGDLLTLREHLAANHQRLRSIVESPRFKKQLGPLLGERLQRVPRGFASDHPAAEFLKHKALYAGHDFTAAETTSPRFYASLLSLFKDMMPLVAFLNEPLLPARRARLR
jgi:uncharacterized protein (TIGR02453 family)